MFSNTKLAHCQQQRIQKYAKNSDSYRFFNLLTSPKLLSTVEELLPEHRERLFPPTETLSMYLAQALSEDRSCQKAVNDAAIKRVMGGLPAVSTGTGGYCRARQRLPLPMVSALVRRTGELIDSQIPEQWRWQNKRVHLIDGTTLSMPDTAENQAAYPQQGSQKPGIGFPICRLLGVICLSSGAVLNAAVGTDEQTLLRKVVGGFSTGEVVLGDAFFGTYFLLADLKARGVDAVFEQMGARKRVTDFRKGLKLGPKDHLIKLIKPSKKPDWMTQEHYDQAPDTLSIRELKVGGKVLITTFLCPKITPRTELKKLYKRRWQIEVDFRNIKSTMGMDVLSCKTPERNEKEIWIYFLAYNLIRLLMAQSALLADLLPRQLSFKHSVQLWLAWSQYGALGVWGNEQELFVLMAQKQIANWKTSRQDRAPGGKTKA